MLDEVLGEWAEALLDLGHGYQVVVWSQQEVVVESGTGLLVTTVGSVWRSFYHYHCDYCGCGRCGSNSTILGVAVSVDQETRLQMLLR